MLKYSQKDLVVSLEKQGLKFTEFSLQSEGDFLPTDADWNYKDVPHLNVVHQQVDAVYSCIGDDVIATINMQKILGFRFPLTVFNYDTGPNRQTYFTNFFVYQLIIETSYEQIGALRTRVKTNYAIGSAALWQVFVPLLKWVLKRNYKDLMSTDIPMRARRGELRAMGYKFRGDQSTYSFRETMKIGATNLIAPTGSDSASFEVDLAEVESAQSLHLGRADHLGLRLEVEGDFISIFPRTCPHEGANLDESKCQDGKLSCPWHARKFSPIVKITRSANQAARVAGGWSVSVVSGKIRINRQSVPDRAVAKDRPTPEATL